MAEDPNSVPAEYRAFGHTCYYSLSPDGGSLSISKSPCAKLCLDDASAASEVRVPL